MVCRRARVIINTEWPERDVKNHDDMKMISK